MEKMRERGATEIEMKENKFFFIEKYVLGHVDYLKIRHMLKV